VVVIETKMSVPVFSWKSRGSLFHQKF